MSHVYCVTVPATTIYVEADSKADARRTALVGMTIDRLDGGEVFAAMRSGAKITCAYGTNDDNTEHGTSAPAGIEDEESPFLTGTGAAAREYVITDTTRAPYKPSPDEE